MHSGEATEAGELAAEQWSNLISGTNELGRVMLEEYGIELVFHPHVDTHVDTQERIQQFLQDTDPRYVNLCLDTGHIAYEGGDNVAIVRGHPDRIHYVHLKQVDPEVRERVRRENLPLSEAVKLGAMVEPPYGDPPMPPLLEPGAKLHKTGQDLIEDPDVHAVVVASWGPTHEEFVLAGIAAGKQVFCEKPLATTREACENILDAEVAAGRRLVMVGFMRRYDQGYRAMKATIDVGEIGAP